MADNFFSDEPSQQTLTSTQAAAAAAAAAQAALENTNNTFEEKPVDFGFSSSTSTFSSGPGLGKSMEMVKDLYDRTRGPFEDSEDSVDETSDDDSEEPDLSRTTQALCSLLRSLMPFHVYYQGKTNLSPAAANDECLRGHCVDAYVWGQRGICFVIRVKMTPIMREEAISDGMDPDELPEFVFVRMGVAQKYWMNHHYTVHENNDAVSRAPHAWRYTNFVANGRTYAMNEWIPVNVRKCKEVPDMIKWMLDLKGRKIASPDKCTDLEPVRRYTPWGIALTSPNALPPIGAKGKGKRKRSSQGGRGRKRAHVDQPEFTETLQKLAKANARVQQLEDAIKLLIQHSSSSDSNAMRMRLEITGQSLGIVVQKPSAQAQPLSNKAEQDFVQPLTPRMDPLDIGEESNFASF